MKNEDKKTVKTLRQPWKIILSFMMIGVSCILCYASIKEIYTMISLQQEIKGMGTKLDETKKTQEKLNEMIFKLQDPEYVRMYARSRFYMTKDEEKIIIINKNEDESAEETE